LLLICVRVTDSQTAQAYLKINLNLHHYLRYEGSHSIAAQRNEQEADVIRERAALGAAILDSSGKQGQVLRTMLHPRYFISMFHQQVFAALCRLADRGLAIVDYSIVIAELLDMGVFQQYAMG
jgi:hypothetical protein